MFMWPDCSQVSPQSLLFLYLSGTFSSLYGVDRRCMRMKGANKGKLFSIVANQRRVSVSSLCGQRTYQKPTSIKVVGGARCQARRGIGGASEHPLEGSLQLSTQIDNRVY